VRCIRVVVMFLTCCSAVLSAQTPGVLGLWNEPLGSTIEVYHCGAAVCARLVAINPKAPSLLDIHNPDAHLRATPLCGLVIGHAFHLSAPNHADSGQLYDPKSGKTYSGEMTSEGSHLDLRGYIGLKIFGRSEIWTRANADIRRCDRK
jgi:uncharacterized protein (DUF2147 family)